jgi:hypothetical protein
MLQPRDACIHTGIAFRVLVGKWVEDNRIWHLVELEM